MKTMYSFWVNMGTFGEEKQQQQKNGPCECGQARWNRSLTQCTNYLNDIVNYLHLDYKQ